MTRLPSYILSAGGAAVPVAIERIGAAPPLPLRTVRLGDRLYHKSLFADILEPFLARWVGLAEDDRPALPAVTESALEQCLELFRSLRRQVPGQPAESILAALAVTANLQRTLIGLAERLAQPATEENPPAVRISRGWCGFSPGRAPVEKAARAAGTLGRAVGCLPHEIEPRCQEVLRRLRQDLRRGGVLACDDRSAYAKRSGAVRLRKSSI